MEPVALPRKGNRRKQKKEKKKNSGNNNEKVNKNKEKKKTRDNKDNKNKNVNKNKKTKTDVDNVNEDINRNNLKGENTDNSETNISNTVGENNSDENIGTRFERNDFPRFPTEVDIMLEVVGKNVDLIQRTCADDIQGRDRACCNSASRCFDDVKGVVDELDNTPVDSFSLMSACRKVSAELKKDKICVQRSLSRCGGPDRVILQRRFDNRVDRLYSQFYKHCNRNAVTTTTTTTTVAPVNKNDVPDRATRTHSLEPTAIVPAWTDSFPHVTPNDHSGHSHDHTGTENNDVTSSSGAIIAGAITGGIVLALVLLVAVILWCRNRREKNGSNGSTDSAGIFFQKRPNVFSTDRPRRENNNKSPVTREDSTIYAEIDEAMVNPGYKPPVPGSLPHMGYLNPVSDDDSGSYTAPPTSNAPVATTRGQLSYGPILAANADHNKKNLFYHSASVTDQKIHNRETVLSPRNLPNGTGSPSDDSDYLTHDSHDASHDDSLDDYEEPISAKTSVRYADIKENSPPDHIAPDVPETTVQKHIPKKNAVKVLPSNPFTSFGAAAPLPQSPEPAQPIAKPRRKKNTDTNGSPETSPNINSMSSSKLGEQELVKRSDVLASNRDSAMSDSSVKSSHHYFVLEPDHTHMDYENSVSSSKLV